MNSIHLKAETQSSEDRGETSPIWREEETDGTKFDEKSGPGDDHPGEGGHPGDGDRRAVRETEVRRSWSSCSHGSISGFYVKF